MNQSKLRKRVSAIIPTKNRAVDLDRAVRSVLSQTWKPNELVIIDQSDSEESKNRVSTLADWPHSGIDLRYVHDRTISGLVEAKKVGVAYSNGDLVFFLEDDVVLQPDYIAQMVEGFEEKPEMMGVCGVVLEMPPRMRYYDRLFHLFHRGMFRDPRVGVFGNPNAWTKKWIPSTALSGGLSAYRRLVFDRVPFDTVNGFFILEDVDFSVRAAREFGQDNFFINTAARLSHLVSPKNRANLYHQYVHKVRTYICFYKKNSHQRLAILSALWLLVGLFLEASFSSVRSRTIDPLGGWVVGIARGFAWKIRPEAPSFGRSRGSAGHL